MGVTLYGHGVYCYLCQEVYEGTDGCDHRLDKKAGIQKDPFDDEYTAKPSDKGHNSPCMFIEVDGMQQCAECDKVKIPTEMVA